MRDIDPAVLVTLIDRLLNFQHPTICRHYVAATLLDILEQHGAPLTRQLAGSVVRGDDDDAIELLPTLGIPYTKRTRT